MLLKKEYWIIGILAILLCISIVAYCSRPVKVKTVIKEVSKIDTEFVETIKQGKITIIKGDAIIEYKPFFIKDSIIDTVFTTKPFTASLDTILRDTFNLKFEFPEKKFEFVLRPVPDTLQTIIIKTEIERQKTFFEKYIEKPLYFSGGVLISYFIYKSVEKK